MQCNPSSRLSVSQPCIFAYVGLKHCEERKAAEGSLRDCHVMGGLKVRPVDSEIGVLRYLSCEAKADQENSIDAIALLVGLRREVKSVYLTGS